MRTQSIAVFAASVVLALASFLPSASQAQVDSARPAAQDFAAEPIGKVVAATGSVTIEHARAVVVQANVSGQAKVGDLVYPDDVVQTGADGRVGINFTDGTSFNLSSSARMALDEYVYDPKGKSNSTMFNLSKGTFTFIAGNIAKTGNMKIDTPVATMGIRGTTPHVEISDDGTTKFDTLIEEGKTKLTNKGQTSKLTDNYFTNVELCNGIGRTSPEARINGCTALIDSRQGTTTTLAIAYNNRGNAYTAKTDYDRAIQDFDQSIKLNPTYIKALNNRGVAYLRKGEYGRAIEAFNEAITLNPNYGEAFANRAGAHLKKNEYDRAASDYDAAIGLDPNLKAVWNGRCWTRAILGALQTALDDCNRALQLDSSSAATYDSRGLIYLKKGQLAAAIADYNSAIRLDPKLASALYGRGIAKLKRGDKAGGNADMSAAKKMQSNVGDDFTSYGVQ